jgi:hypothetical protein
MVNVVNDPRFAMARLMRQQAQSGSSGGYAGSALPPAPSKESVSLGRAAVGLSIANPTLRQQIDAIAEGSSGNQPKGFWGTVIGNPVTKTALKGLEAFAIPGRAVVAGLREGFDAIDGNADTKASFKDFSKNMKDSTYGFGKAFKINTGNLWVDRAIGFIGDVALDPITYATFGAGKAAGYAGRVKLAEEVLRNTGDNVLAAAVARQGRSALVGRADVLERVGANKFGVYFFGKRVKIGTKHNGAVRLPLSGTIGEIGEKTLAKARLAITETKFGQKLQRLTMPKDFLDMRLKLARGQLKPEDAADALRLFDIVPKQRAAKAVALQAYEQELMALLRSQEAELPSYRNTVYRLLEDPTNLATATPAEQRAYEIWKDYLDKKWEDVSARWLEADEAAEIGRVANYVPRVATDDARRFLNSNNPYADDVRAVFQNDPFALPGAFTPRSLAPRKKWFGKVLTEEDMNIDSLNRIAREEGGIDFDFFETDIAEIMRRYISDTADEVGIIERNKLLRETGFFQRIEEQRVNMLDIDEDEVNLLRQIVEEQTNALDEVERGFRQSVVDLVDGVRAQSVRVDNDLTTVKRLSDDMSKYLYDMLDDVARRIDEVNRTKERLAVLWGNSSDIPMYSVSDDFPVMLRPVLGQFDTMVKDLEDFQMIISDLQAQAMKDGFGVEQARSALRQIEESAADAQRRMQEANDSIKSAMEVSNELERVWDSLVNGVGRRVEGTAAAAVVNQIRDILGVKTTATPANVSKARAKSLGIRGSLKNFLRGNLPDDATPEEIAALEFFEKVWKRANESGLAGISRSRVSDMSEEQFLKIVLNTSSKDVNINDLRAAAVYAIGKDIRLYKAASFDELPEFSRNMFKELMVLLKEADLDEASRIAVGKATKKAREAEDALRARMGYEYDTAITLRDQINDYKYVTDLISLHLAKEVGEGWTEIPFDESIVSALEEAIGIPNGMSKNIPWLYEYVDDAETVLGKPAEEVTLGDVLSDIVSKYNRAKNTFDSSKVRIQDTRPSNLVAGNSETQVLPKNYQQVINEYEAEMRRISDIKARESKVFEYSRWQYNKEKKSSHVRNDLADRLVKYQAVSDAVQKFEAIAGVLAPHGLIPTEDMWRGILRTVSHQYGRQFSERVSRLNVAEEKFTEFYAMFTKSLQEMRRLPAEEQTAVGVLFKEALASVVDGPDGEILKEIIGSSMVNMVDVADMYVDIRTLKAAVRNAGNDAQKQAAQSRLDNYVDTYVIPWAKSQDPEIRANKGPALKVLTERAKGDVAGARPNQRSLNAVRTPLSRDATESDVYRWFNSMLKTVDPETGNVISQGAIRQSILDYAGSEIFFRRMADGYLDIDQFFKTLDGSRNTPSSYAVQINEWAKVIEGSTLVSNPNIRVDVLEEIGTEFRQAYKKGPRVAEKATEEANNLAEAATRAREVADAFNNPNLTLEQLKALGFTRKMLESREAVLAHKRATETVAYANALKDQDMINFLDAVAGVNLAAFTDGFVVNTRRTPVYAEDAVPVTPEVVADKTVKLQAQLEEIDSLERTSRRAVLQPFVVEKDGKVRFKNPELKKLWQTRDEAWVRTEKRNFDYQRTKVQEELDKLQSSVGEVSPTANIPVYYENVPIYATMPDGSVLKFTQAEWDSLYQKPLKGLEVVAFNKERAGLVQEIAELRRKLKDASERPGATWDPSRKRAIRNIEKDILRAQDRIKEIDYELLRSFKETRNAALEKLRILVQGQVGDGSDAIKMSEWEDITEQLSARQSLRFEQRGGFEEQVQGTGQVAVGSEDILVYKVSTPDGKVTKQVNPTLSQYFAVARKNNPQLKAMPTELSAVRGGADVRKEELFEIWQSHPSFRVLANVDELAQAAAMSVYESSSKNAQMLRRAADEAADAAVRTQTAVTDVQRSFRKAIEEMRNSELQAAKAAGAEFDTPTPFWATNKEVTYTLNGKSYTVPSVADMLADPMKYVKQARKRGDIFFDIKKPGNVTMWNDASNEVRASVALFSLQNIVLTDKANLFEAGVLNPSINRLNETFNVMEQWSQDLAGLADRVKVVRDALEVERATASADVIAAQADATAAKLDAFEFAAELRAMIDEFDPSIELSPNGMMQMDSLVSSLEKRANLLESIIRNMPSKANTKSLETAKQAATREKWMKVHMDWINSTRASLRALATADLADGADARIWNAWLNAAAAEGRFILQQGKVQTAQQALDAAEAGVYVEKVLKPATKEFDKAVKKILKEQNRKVAKNFNMPSYSVSAELNDIMKNVNRITDAASVRELSRFLGRYTGFFKAYATLSPGFHVRNSISNTFQLFAAGADVKNMNEGLRLWRTLGEHIKGGGTFESWLATLPEPLRVNAKIAGEVTLGLGGGKTEDAFAEFIDLNKNLLTSNVATRTSRRFGQKLEGSARFMLAFDSATKGMDFTESFNRTRRFLVDYNDPTILDDTVRNVIPFWTWISRNLPVQIVTQWTNPKPYVIYQRFANNFRVEEDEQLPDYMKKQNPIKVGDSTYLALDLPFMSTQRVIEDTANPRKLLGMVNPGLRVPVEVTAGRPFFTGRDFNEDNTATKYAATNLLPMLGQIERITRSGDASDELGLARYLGVPIRGVTEKQKENELVRRLYEIQNLANQNREQ